jgi:hypothetical protein
MTLVKLDTAQIQDRHSFHDVFAETFGFPNGYGRNMDAWIECMTCLDDPESGMSSVHAPPGGTLVLQLEEVDSFAARCPELYAAVVECSALVNWRRIENGGNAVLALSFYKSK